MTLDLTPKIKSEEPKFSSFDRISIVNNSIENPQRITLNYRVGGSSPSQRTNFGITPADA